MQSENAIVDEKVVLDAIRTDFVSDGLSWANLSEDRKMVHLWRKLKRTEEALKSAHQDTKLIKQQRKEEMVGIEEFISNIRSLSQQKDVFTRQLEAENENLRKELRDRSAEQKALLSENSIVGDLLAAAGVYPNAGSISNQMTLLLNEQKESQIKMKLLAQEREALTEELKTLRTVQKDINRLSDELGQKGFEMDSAAKANASLQQEVQLLTQQFGAKKKDWEEEKLKFLNTIEGKAKPVVCSSALPQLRFKQA